MAMLFPNPKPVAEKKIVVPDPAIEEEERRVKENVVRIMSGMRIIVHDEHTNRYTPDDDCPDIMVIIRDREDDDNPSITAVHPDFPLTNWNIIPRIGRQG